VHGKNDFAEGSNILLDTENNFRVTVSLILFNTVNN